MKRSDLRALWRLRVKDTRPPGSSAPYLWSDFEFNAFLDDAQREAARRAHLIVDSTSSLTQITASTGELVIALDPRVLFVRRARMASSGIPLAMRSAKDMDEGIPGWESSSPSTPRIYVLDYQTNALVLWPPASSDDTIKLTVVREPMEDIPDDETAPEINARYHLALLDWVSFRAYSVQDADAGDPEKAREALAAFEQEFGPKVGAFNEHWSLEQYSDVGDYQ